MMLRTTLGLASLALGLVGLLIPLIPGIPLLIIAWLLLRRGDQHWRSRSLRLRTLRLREGDSADISFADRVQLRVLQGTAQVLEHLDRAERRLRGGSR